MTEYVKFSGHEKIYGEKNVLYIELDLLKMLKRVDNFKNLRQEELVLKIALKKRISELIEAMNLIDKLIPHHKMRGLHKEEEIMDEAEKKKNWTLEQELEAIRRKLEELEAH